MKNINISWSSTEDTMILRLGKYLKKFENYRHILPSFVGPFIFARIQSRSL